MAGARIDYVELPSATAHELTRGFYRQAFGWSFTDFGPDYSAMTTGDVDVGLNGQPEEALAAPLPVPGAWSDGVGVSPLFGFVSDARSSRTLSRTPRLNTSVAGVNDCSPRNCSGAA